MRSQFFRRFANEFMIGGKTYNVRYHEPFVLPILSQAVIEATFSQEDAAEVVPLIQEQIGVMEHPELVSESRLQAIDWIPDGGFIRIGMDFSGPHRTRDKELIPISEVPESLYSIIDEDRVLDWKGRVNWMGDDPSPVAVKPGNDRYFVKIPGSNFLYHRSQRDSERTIKIPVEILGYKLPINRSVHPVVYRPWDEDDDRHGSLKDFLEAPINDDGTRNFDGLIDVWDGFIDGPYRTFRRDTVRLVKVG